MDHPRKNKRKSSLDHQSDSNASINEHHTVNGGQSSVEKKLRVDHNGGSPQLANGSPSSPLKQLHSSPLEVPVEVNGMLQFKTEQLPLWVSSFQLYYSEHQSVTILSGPNRSGDEPYTQLTLAKTQASENGSESPLCDANSVDTKETTQDGEMKATWLCVKFWEKCSLVTVSGPGVEEWKVCDFLQLRRRVCELKKDEKDAVQNGVGTGHQRTASSDLSIPSKRYRLSLKANKSSPAAQQVASLFKKANGDMGKATIVGTPESGKNTTRTPCVATLHNLGNTCFLSSVLQVLRYTAGFVDSINTLAEQIRQTEKNDAERKESSSEEDADEENLTWTLIKNLQHVYRQMSEAESGFTRNTTSYLGIRPYNLLECIEKLNPMYEGSQQQDAHELLHCLLSYIQDGVRKVNARRKCTVKVAPEASITSTATVQPEPRDEPTLNGIGDGAESDGNDVTHDDEEEEEEENMPLSEMTKTDALSAVNTSSSDTVNTAQKRVHRPGPRRRLRKFDSDGQSSITAFLRPKESAKLSMSAVVCLDRRPVTQLLGNATAEPVASLFRGSMELRTRCLDCDGATSRREDYLDIGVPVAASDAVTEDNDEDDEEETSSEAAWLLSALGEVERLRDVNKYFCEQCLRLVEAERSMHYMTTPPMLTLHLKRFATRSGNFGCITKVTRHVSVPMILPCIRDTCKHQCNIVKHRYQLYAIITHTGISISSGHYVAYVRAPTSDQHQHNQSAYRQNSSDSNNNVNGTSVAKGYPHSSDVWYECDDDSAKVLSQQEFESIMSPSGGGSPYLLFYCQPAGGRRNAVIR